MIPRAFDVSLEKVMEEARHAGHAGPIYAEFHADVRGNPVQMKILASRIVPREVIVTSTSGTR